MESERFSEAVGNEPRCSRTALTLGERPFVVEGDRHEQRYMLTVEDDHVAIYHLRPSGSYELLGEAQWDGEELVECDDTLHPDEVNEATATIWNATRGAS